MEDKIKDIEEMNNVKKEIICNLKSKSKKIGGLI